MSKFLIYLHVEPYIRQWLIHSFGNPVEFPASSNENAVIRRFTQKQPASLKPQKPSEDEENIRYVGVTTLTVQKRFYGHKYCAKHDDKRGLPVHKWMYSHY